MANAVRGHRPKAQSVGHVQQGLVRGLLLAPAVPLHVQEDARGPERLEHAGQAVRVGRAAQRLRPGQRHQPFDAALQPVEGQPALSFRPAGLHARDEPAEALVAHPALHEQRQAASAFEGQLGADEGPDSRRPRGLEEPRGPRDPVPVHERHRRMAEVRRPGHEVLGQRGGPEEREGRRGMELGVQGARAGDDSFAVCSPSRREIPVESSRNRPLRSQACWARLTSKVYHADPLVCRQCGGKLKVVAYVSDEISVKRILTHVG